MCLYRSPRILTYIIYSKIITPHFFIEPAHVNSDDLFHNVDEDDLQQKVLQFPPLGYLQILLHYQSFLWPYP